MKIKDIMQTSVIAVSEETPIKEVARMIFSSGISGAPVVKVKKLVGIITEEDILSHIYSPKEKNPSDAEVERGIVDLLDQPVSSIMNTTVNSVNDNTTLMEVQRLMLSHRFSRVPVVNSEGELIGIVSQGDIFREVLKDEMPTIEKDRFIGFMGDQYDLMINWEQRFEQEFPSLFRIFKRENVKSVLDLGVWSGIFSIGLAEEGLQVTALEQNKTMFQLAHMRWEKLPADIKSRIEFLQTDYTDINKVAPKTYDAVLCLGNSLLYLPGSLSDIFSQAYKALRKDGIIVLQIINADRVLNRKKRLLNFQIQKPSETPGHERLFLEFLDKKDEQTLKHNLVVFDSAGDNWVYQGETTIEIKHVEEEELVKTLQKVGFNEISVAGYQGEYQGEYGPISFIKPFDQKTSDWMTIIAKKE